ncbi:hypothetical protein SARC_06704 [Sphaeroforma arctica JP610]|uniref:Uncharacterized protein n=1 Tax=Sphaeroforma arctica JP610 TaxID=667725 RepID=A0A0L0FVT0_9EUKA|nr:hypothetical protein SARC_06704 [Sphaeroforma arctica JP610]KNC80955.1 hypothetical protein SARC_06704 [Sphaeroforma arctica JP610]|eukprot:XP_014154857.1 hypothetical protein SARC_06704 [Sphaeroforma arctica JP610]
MTKITKDGRVVDAALKKRLSTTPMGDIPFGLLCVTVLEQLTAIKPGVTGRNQRISAVLKQFFSLLPKHDATVHEIVRMLLPHVGGYV